MKQQLTFAPVKILLIEDNPLDIHIVSQAFRESNLEEGLNVVQDGMAAMDYLHGCDSEREGPDLILLDLNLPKKSGFEILSEIKSDKKLKLIPVIVLSGSQSEGDVAKAYKLQANLYIQKPIDFNEFVKVAHFIADLCKTVKLPKGNLVTPLQ